MSSNSVSTSFNKIKVVREQLKRNLTTAQLLRTYDDCINKAIEPLVRNTVYVDRYLASLLPWQESNHRRKVTFHKPKEAITKILSYLMLEDTDLKAQAFKELKVDRGVSIFILDSYVRDHEYLLDLFSNVSIDLEVRDLGVSAKDEAEFNRLRTVIFWLAKVKEFGCIIQEKYMRMTILAAKRDYTQFFKDSIPLDDVISTYMVSCIRAIHKCDSDKGTLTNHIANWFFTGREAIWKQKGIYYKDINSIAIQSGSYLDSSEVTDIMEDDIGISEEEGNEDPHVNEADFKFKSGIIEMVSRIMDPDGAGRLYLGISEKLTIKEISEQQT